MLTSNSGLKCVFSILELYRLDKIDAETNKYGWMFSNMKLSLEGDLIDAGNV